MTPEGFNQGDRVLTPLGPASVAYVRFAQRNELAAVSVVLDARRGDVGYTGTIFDPAKVAPICGELAALHPIDPRD